MSFIEVGSLVNLGSQHYKDLRVEYFCLAKMHISDMKPSLFACLSSRSRSQF
jgi:hypothetical protein